jgi:predicted phosphodiesterase
VVYGHTHHPLHEIIGPVEHLNSGTWSPNFGDVECKIQNTKRNYIIIQPIEGAEGRVASLEVWE